MSKHVTIASWDDAPHLSPEAKAGLIDAYQPHERDARTKGIPSLGAGAIYPVAESDVVCKPFEIPSHWKHCFALDVGWNRTAALWGAIDSESDVAYLYSEYYRGQAEPAIHAQAIRSRGGWIPGVIDPASRGRSQHDGQRLFEMYQNLGLLSLSFADNAVDAGIYAVWLRLSTGRLKVFSTLQNWWSEYRIYRRDEKGKVVKENDHLMDCTKYLVVSGIPIAAFRSLSDWAERSGRSDKPRMESEYDPFSVLLHKPAGESRSFSDPWQASIDAHNRARGR